MTSGYILKADPRQQFWAQFLGVTAGSLFVVSAYHLLVPSADVLGSDKWPAPSGQTWKSVAELSAKGFSTLHPTAQAAFLIGSLLSIAQVLLEHYLPRWKKFIPSPTGLGMAFTKPVYNTIAMFIGALVALWLEKKNPKFAQKVLIPIGSGFIADESRMGLLIAILVVLGVLA